jgi:glucosamine--fructose-6-phosphate aminotransferase (isomerizing)
MCGIFGFVSSEPQNTNLILLGLKELEYRGYDSWGIATKKESRIIIEKHAGKIGGATLNPKFSTLNSNVAIGHTRWATHGGATALNSHPHLDCTKTLALIHNGIFENYEEIKKGLIQKGHKFLSETDSEVIVHLIEEETKTNSYSTSVKNAFKKVKGLNAIVVMSTASKEIIVCKNGSPLIIGFSPKTIFVSSDISAFPKNCTKAVILKDNEMAIIGENLKVFNLVNDKGASFKTEKFETQNLSQTKGEYPHYLLKEIHEQPQILEKLYNLEANSAKLFAREIKNAYGTFTLGCGSASYAAMAGEYFLSKIAKTHINFSVGSEFKYLQSFITSKSLIIPVSQSGETIDIIEPVKKAREKNAKVISIINNITSTLSQISDLSLLIHAGVEKAVVGTKSFTAMVGLFLLISYATSGNIQKSEALLQKASKDTKNILSKTSVENIKKLVKTLQKHDFMFTIGRGISYVTALEAALKLKETALIHAEGFAGGELKHGVIALIEKGTPCFVFAPNDETYLDIISNAREIKARGGFIIGIGPKNNSVFDVFLETEDLKEATIISQTVYMQLLAYFLALRRGVEDPDKPRNLAKSVTVK